MRIFIKGGVWKNTEDEILKAAVMKYGKNQWARISSLLVRKSAKQCKARWYDWLDPSIKKTEWSREEEEKLLHLAKIMPTQWRNIAMIVGRTPAQCLEHYEKMLDQAQGKEIDAADDPRRLKPGEIDPNPETKPARPDPVDMDEDEKEMLQEARARLANTRGKKAKRKAREKQLEEARRLSSLQKRRELKAAGIHLGRRRIRKGVDYNSEIPFEKKVPIGFFATPASETPDINNSEFLRRSLQDIEGKKRIDQEIELRKKDREKQRKRAEQDLPSAVMQLNKLNDPETLRQRSRLVMPAPQMSDTELQDIVKQGVSAETARAAAGDQTSTRGLLANYATPGHAAFRTPRTPASSDALMKEAMNLVTLTTSATPLAGGENTPLHDSDFSGMTPKPSQMATPNIHATPARGGMGGGATPARIGGMTPMRDGMGINAEEGGQLEDPRAEKARQRSFKASLREKLADLPKPANAEFEVVMPEVPDDEKDDEVAMEADQGDIEAAHAARLKAIEEDRLKSRSASLKRGLPRPQHINNDIFRVEGAKLSELQAADELVKQEMLVLLKTDSDNWPLSGKKRTTFTEIEKFSAGDIEAAERLLQEESAAVEAQAGEVTPEVLEKLQQDLANDLVFVPSAGKKGKLLRLSKAKPAERIAALEYQLDTNRNHMSAEHKKAKKSEKRVVTYTQGYQTRASKLIEEIVATHEQIKEASRNLACYRELYRREAISVPSRVQAKTTEVNFQMKREADLQARYANLVNEHRDLLAASA